MEGTLTATITSSRQVEPIVRDDVEVCLDLKSRLRLSAVPKSRGMHEKSEH